jgi:hypothetical protein
LSATWDLKRGYGGKNNGFFLITCDFKEIKATKCSTGRRNIFSFEKDSCTIFKWFYIFQMHLPYDGQLVCHIRQEAAFAFFKTKENKQK